MKHRSGRTTGFQPTALIAGVLLLLIVFVSVGYFFFLYQPGLSVEQEAALAELRDRRTEWEDERPPGFRYEVERRCECPLEYTEPFAVVEYLDEADNRAWLDEFFALIEATMLAGQPVSVSYDARFGYPNDFTIANEDTFVRDFEVLRYADESP
jgi:hypothetical protein